MLLNAVDIKRRKLLRRSKDENFKEASYNLTIGKIVTLDGKELTSFFLAPRGMVLMVSEELFDLPNNVIGYTTVKNNLSINGIMAINVGIVDSLWKKPISSLLINFGNTSYLFEKGDEFLRMTFHDFEKVDMSELGKIKENNLSSDALDFESYLKFRKKESVQKLSTTFLSINSIIKDISKHVSKKILRNVIIFIGLLGLLTFLISYSKDVFDFRKSLSNKIYHQQIDSLNMNLINIKRELDSIKLKQLIFEQKDETKKQPKRTDHI